MSTIVADVWTKGKILVKAGIIVVLVLLLMIPAHYVQELVREREARQKEAIAEVSGKWAGRQTVTGPMIVLPYWQTESETGGKRIRSKHYAFFLPEELSIKATVTPQQRKRGIYQVMLYTSAIAISGSFNQLSLQKLNIPAEDVLWAEAFIKVNIADVKGLNDELVINWNGQAVLLSPQAIDDRSGAPGLTAPILLQGPDALKDLRFATQFNLNGTEQVLFTPVGKATTVALSSRWPHPSFTGDILPQSSSIKDSGFSATWKSLAHRRSFPQQWKDDAYTVKPFYRPVEGSSYANVDYATPSATVNTNINASAFGADLFVPVNSYQKTMRSVKYAILCILLTFAAFFLIETANKRSVHPFHYGLIGIALILFYTLLLSFSEYIGFDLSYVIASVATIGLIACFVKGILGSFRLSGILSGVLVLVYAYVFTILQLQDYSLLFGSIGLFVTLGVIMYFSRKFQW